MHAGLAAHKRELVRTVSRIEVSQHESSAGHRAYCGKIHSAQLVDPMPSQARLRRPSPANLRATRVTGLVKLCPRVAQIRVTRAESLTLRRALGSPRESVGQRQFDQRRRRGTGESS